MLWRSALQADSTAMLAPGSCRRVVSQRMV